MTKGDSYQNDTEVAVKTVISTAGHQRIKHTNAGLVSTFIDTCMR